MNKNDNSILIVNDICGYGRVSTFAMLPVMSHYGLHPYILPTALVSNTLDYGTSEILDTTEFMKGTVKKWNELNLHFGCIATGFINSDEQADIIIDLIDSQDSPLVFVDPIMAEDGELYPDMYPGAIECNKRLAKRATVIMPNFTEALFLTGLFEGRKTLTSKEFEILLEELTKLGPRDIVIKSCSDEDGSNYNLVYEGLTDTITKVYYTHIPTPFIGTGDIYSSVLISEYLNGKTLTESVRKAADFICDVIRANENNEDKFDIRHEQCLSLLSKK